MVISNLTNIITANYFKIEFLEFAKNMFLPNFFCFAFYYSYGFCALCESFT
ncbi:hypothetical protein OLR58_01120 [Campylobacter jejuni]|nr:hypothetical protein [Campylobacter jejuni]MCW1524352.1 hypothetical protein [Campylobacter jejuni]